MPTPKHAVFIVVTPFDTVKVSNKTLDQFECMYGKRGKKTKAGNKLAQIAVEAIAMWASEKAWIAGEELREI